MAGTSLAVTLLLDSRAPELLAEHAWGHARVPCRSNWGKRWSGRCSFCC